METQHDAARRESPEERGIEEASVAIERAWREQVKRGRGLTPDRTLCRIARAVAGRLSGRDHLVLFPRLGQLG